MVDFITHFINLSQQPSSVILNDIKDIMASWLYFYIGAHFLYYTISRLLRIFLKHFYPNNDSLKMTRKAINNHITMSVILNFLFIH